MTNPFDDQARLIQALKHQEIVNHNENRRAQARRGIWTDQECKEEKCIFEQSDLCNDIYFILAGEVAIHVNRSKAFSRAAIRRNGNCESGRIAFGKGFCRLRYASGKSKGS